MKKKYKALIKMGVFILLIGCNKPTIQNEDEGRMSFTVSVLEGKKVMDDYRLKWLEEKFNVNIEIKTLNWGDNIKKTRLWLSAGDIPDVMWYDLSPNGIGRNELIEAVEGGLLQAVPYRSYPHLSKLYEKMNDIKRILIDDEVYYWTSLRTMPREYYPFAGEFAQSVKGQFVEGQSVQGLATENKYFHSVGWIYRRDWAEALGLAKENNIYTIDEFRNLMKAFKEQDPANNGKGNTLGATFVRYGFPDSFALWGGFDYGRFVYQKTDAGRYTWIMALPEMRETMRQAKLFYDEAVWKDQIVMTGLYDGRDKFAAGLSGAYHGNTTLSRSAVLIKGLKARNPSINIIDAIQMLFVSNDEGRVFQIEPYLDYWGGWSLNADLSKAKVNRFMEIMDFLASKEGKRFILYGIPNQDYAMSGDEVKVLWEKDETGIFKRPFISSGSRFFNFAVLTERYEPLLLGIHPLVKMLNLQQKKVYELEKRGILIDPDKQLLDIKATMKVESKPLPDLKKTTITFITDLFSNQDIKDFDMLYDEFLEKNRANAKKLIDEVHNHL